MVLGRLLRTASGSSSNATPVTTPKVGPATDPTAPKEAGLTGADAGAGAEQDEDWELVESTPQDRDGEVDIDGYLVLEGKDSKVEDLTSVGESITPRPSESSAETTAQPPGGLAKTPPPAVVAEEPISAVKAEDEVSLGGASTESSAGVPEEEDVTSFRCRICRAPIFKASDVISANYHAQTSPGYLINNLSGISVSTDEQICTYTTGKYTVKNVACDQCGQVLGVTYSGTDSIHNQYKVGKFLVGIDRLVLPLGTVHPMDKSKH